MVNKKGNIFVLILAALAIVFTVSIFAWYKLQPKTTPVPQAPETKTNETVSWKTYTNNELGISFDYPLGGKFENKNDEIWFDYVRTNYNAYNFIVKALDENKSNSLITVANKYYSNAKNCGSKSDRKTSQLENVVIAGAPSFGYEVGECMGGPSMEFITSNGNRFFQIKWLYFSGDTQNKIYLGKILSTFKFL